MTQSKQDQEAEVYTHYQALSGAIEHIRAAKGILDTYSLTKKEAADVELLAVGLEKKLAPLAKKLERRRAW